MPTIFEQLESALSGNEVAPKLSAQTGSLGAVGTALTSLASHPPEAIGDFASSLDQLPLPDVSTRRRHRGEARRDEGRRSFGRVGRGGSRGRACRDRLLAVGGARACAVGRAAKPSTRSSGSRTSTCAAATRGGRRPASAVEAPAPAAGDPGRGRDAAAAPPATAGLKEIRGLLEAAPSPLDTDGVLNLLHEATAWEDRDRLLLHFVPLLDDIADPLATLLDWRDKSPTSVRIALKKSLDDAVAFVEARRDAGTAGATVTLAGVAGKLQTDALATIADGPHGPSPRAPHRRRRGQRRRHRTRP